MEKRAGGGFCTYRGCHRWFSFKSKLNTSSWLAKAFAHSLVLHTHWPIKNSECQKKSLECTFLIFKNQQKWQVIFTCKAMHWIIEGTVKPWQGDSIVEIIPESTRFENHSQQAKQTAAESSNKSTKDIQHCLERGIFVSTVAFAYFPMSFKAKCQMNWYAEIIAHCVAI